MKKRPMQFFVNNEGDPAKYVQRISNILCKMNIETQKYEQVQILASGQAIELALEIATLVKSENKQCIHQVISQRVHLTDVGESLHKRNELD